MTDEIDEIEALLPWYAAGALSDKERAAVGAALAARPELRASLATVEEDLGETVALNETLGAPSPEVWARVMRGVAASPHRPAVSERLAAWFGYGVEGRSPWPALAGVAAALVIAAQAATIVSLLRPGGQKSGYATVTATTSTADALVAFAPDAKMADVAALLTEHQATIVSGPRASGLYGLKLAAKPRSKAEIEAAVKALAASPLVRLALPGSGR